MEQATRNTEIADQAIKYTELQGVRNDLTLLQKEIRTTHSDLELAQKGLGENFNNSLDDFKDETKNGLMMLDKRMQNGFEQSRNSLVDLPRFEEFQ